jgi:hypothetical protein
MRPSQAPLLQHLGKVLRVQYHPIISERVPERWIDLINYLNEKERSPPQDLPPKAKPERQRASKRR